MATAQHAQRRYYDLPRPLPVVPHFPGPAAPSGVIPMM